MNMNYEVEATQFIRPPEVRRNGRDLHPSMLRLNWDYGIHLPGKYDGEKSTASSDLFAPSSKEKETTSCYLSEELLTMNGQEELTRNEYNNLIVEFNNYGERSYFREDICMMATEQTSDADTIMHTNVDQGKPQEGNDHNNDPLVTALSCTRCGTTGTTNKICVIYKNAHVLYGMSSRKRTPSSDNEESDEEQKKIVLKEPQEINRLTYDHWQGLKYSYVRSLTECATRIRIPKSLQKKWVVQVYEKLHEINIRCMRDILTHVTEINEWLIRGKLKPFHKETIKIMHERALEIEIETVEQRAYTRARKELIKENELTCLLTSRQQKPFERISGWLIRYHHQTTHVHRNHPCQSVSVYRPTTAVRRHDQTSERRHPHDQTHLPSSRLPGPLR
jgi:hypothetical protein